MAGRPRLQLFWWRERSCHPDWDQSGPLNSQTQVLSRRAGIAGLGKNIWVGPLAAARDVGWPVGSAKAAGIGNRLGKEWRSGTMQEGRRPHYVSQQTGGNAEWAGYAGGRVWHARGAGTPGA